MISHSTVPCKEKVKKEVAKPVLLVAVLSDGAHAETDHAH